MLERDQLEALLQEKMIEKVLKFLEENKLSKARLVAPYTSDQKGKINILVDDADEVDYYLASKLNQDLREKVAKRDDINLLIESHKEPSAVKIHLKETINFDRASIENEYNRRYKKDKDIDVDVDEGDQEVKIVIVFKKAKGAKYNQQEIIKFYEVSTEELFGDDKRVKQNSKLQQRMAGKSKPLV